MSEAKQQKPVPPRCMINCPERPRCDLRATPTRCAVYRAVVVRKMRTSR